MGVLARSWYTNGARPVVVQVSELVGQALKVVWCQPGAVLNHVVMGWRHRSLTDRLADKKEVIPFFARDISINDSARRWVRQIRSTSRSAENPGTDPLLHDDHGKLGFVATCNLLEGCFELRDFMLHNKPQLSITHAVTVNDYSLGQVTVYFTVFPQCGCHTRLQFINQLHTSVLEGYTGMILGQGCSYWQQIHQQIGL